MCVCIFVESTPTCVSRWAAAPHIERTTGGTSERWALTPFRVACRACAGVHCASAYSVLFIFLPRIRRQAVQWAATPHVSRTFGISVLGVASEVGPDPLSGCVPRVCECGRVQLAPLFFGVRYLVRPQAGFVSRHGTTSTASCRRHSCEAVGSPTTVPRANGLCCR